MKTYWKILIGLAALLGIAVLVAVTHHFQLKAAVNRYRAELIAKGELMELAQVIPQRVPPEKNSAAQFLAAANLFVTNESVLTTNWPIGMSGVAPGKARILWRQDFIRDFGMTNSWEDLALALEANKEAFNRLVAITNSSVFDFGLQYEQRFEMRITNLMVEKKTVQKLAAKTFNDLRLEQTGPAAENIRVMLALGEGTSDERTAISQLVRIALTQIAVAATWEFLQSSNLTDGQLAGLQADWSRLEFIRAAEHFLPVEREGSGATLAKWRSSNSELQRYFDLTKQAHENFGLSDEEVSEDSIWSRAKMKGQIFLWRYWWSYTDELRYLKGWEVLMNTVRLANANGFFQSVLAAQDIELNHLGISKLNNSFDALFSGKTDFHSMLSESIVTLGEAIRKIMRVEAAKQMTMTAIALKRFQLRRGNYPADLNSLMPEFIATVPLDPVDGQPLRYRRNTDGTFLLYSVGENGVDDGGNPVLEPGVTSSSYSWQNPHALDWVWPQPATEEEIERHYADTAAKPK